MKMSAHGFYRWARLGLLLLAGLLLVGCASYEFKGTPFAEGRMAADFALQTGDGQAYRLSDRRGQVVLMFFGYTGCPDICPTTLSDARQVLEGLGGEADGVDFLFITVDPERDTAEKLAEYAAFFHPDIRGLTGDPEALAAMRDSYGVVAEKEVLSDSAAGYLVNHTARIFLVDQAGHLRLSYRFGTPPDDILADVRHLLQL